MRTIILSYLIFGNTQFWGSLTLEKFIYGIVNCWVVFYRFLFHSHFRDLSIWMEPTLSTKMPFMLIIFNFLIYIIIFTQTVKRRYFRRIVFCFSILIICYWLACVFTLDTRIFNIFLKKNILLSIQNAHYFIDYLNLVMDLKNFIGVPKSCTLKLPFEKGLLHCGVIITFLCLFYVFIYYKSETVPTLQRYQVRVSSWNLLTFLIIVWIVIACSWWKSFVFVFMNIIIQYFFNFLLRSKNLQKHTTYFFKNRQYFLLKITTFMSLLTIDVTNILQIHIKTAEYVSCCFIVLWFAYFLWMIEVAKVPETPNTLPIIWGVLVPIVSLFSFINLLPREKGPACACLLLLFLLFFYKNTARVLTILPTYATERERKYLMFTAAKKAVDPIRLFNLHHFNDNAYLMMSKTLTLSWLLFGIFTTATTVDISNPSVYCLIVVLSIYPWFMFFGATLIKEEMKSLSVLNWRGMFLAKYQFHNICKYNTLLLQFIPVLLLILMIVSIISANYIYSIKIIIAYVFFVCLLLSVLLFERAVTAWVKTQTYFRDYRYKHWTDEFWKLMSPLLRDFVYWKPIPPDDWIEDRPYYLGFRFMYSTNIILKSAFLGMCVYLCVHFDATPNIIQIVLFWNLKVLVTLWYAWTLCRLFRYTLNKNDETILSYTSTIRGTATAWTIIYAITGWVFLW